MDFTKEKQKYFFKFNRPNDSIVDYGGGTGKIINDLNIKEKYIIDIIDRTPEHIEFFKPQGFDKEVSTVLMSMSLHHFKEPQEALKEIVNILKPNGALLLREIDCNSSELKRLHKEIDLEWSHHPGNTYFNHQSRLFWEELISQYFKKGEYVFEKDNPLNVYWQIFYKI